MDQEKEIEESQVRFVRQVSELLTSLEEKEPSWDAVQQQISELRQHVENPNLLKALREKTAPIVRKAVTGDSHVKVREWLKQAKVVKAIDKATFVGSICFLQTTQFAMVQLPELFRLYFVASATILLALRLYSYTRARMQYFLLDYCYLTNLLCILNALVFPNSRLFWRINFVAANGPLLWAIVAWRNSLVFHSLDKMVSVFIHIVPALLTFTERWLFQDATPMCKEEDGEHCSLDLATHLLLPLSIFAVWQVAYLLFTEHFRRHRFEANPDLMTSLRWIVKDQKSTIHKILLRCCRLMGRVGMDEELDMAKTPFAIMTVYVFLQSLYTFLTFCPTWLFFRSRELHALVLVLIFLRATFNGANFYFEVFAKRYNADVQKTN